MEGIIKHCLLHNMTLKCKISNFLLIIQFLFGIFSFKNIINVIYINEVWLL
jgi:hypothetical protein